MLFPVTPSDNCKLLMSCSPVSSKFTFFFWTVTLLTQLQASKNWTCEFLRHVALYFIFYFLILYMDSSDPQHLNFSFCLTRSISLQMFPFLLSCQVSSNLMICIADVLRHLVLEALQKRCIATVIFAVIFWHILFRGSEIQYMHFINYCIFLSHLHLQFSFFFFFVHSQLEDQIQQEVRGLIYKHHINLLLAGYFCSSVCLCMQLTRTL